MEEKAKFDFSWKYDDFEIRTTHTYGKEQHQYIELVKWEEDGKGRPHCFTLAYFARNKEGDYSLTFISTRPFEYMSELDLSPIWKQLFLAQQMFEDAEQKASEESF